jgi:hypothetical protein
MDDARATVRAAIRKGMSLVVMLLVGICASLGQQPAKDPTPLAYIGVIMDSQCGKTGSHAAMMKKEGTKDAKDCTDHCVKMGGQYVLYDLEAKTMFQLDDQDKAAGFAGKKVKVVGSFDPATKTIHIQAIEEPTVSGAS